MNSILSCPILLHHFNFNVDAGGQTQILQRIHRLERCLREINEPAVRAHFELVARVLEFECSAEHRKALDLSRERNGTVYHGATALCGIDDLACGFIQNRMIKSVEPEDRKSTRLNSSHSSISYAVFCLKK